MQLKGRKFNNVPLNHFEIIMNEDVKLKSMTNDNGEYYFVKFVEFCLFLLSLQSSRLYLKQVQVCVFGLSFICILDHQVCKKSSIHFQG